jgi:hypothetical protein
MRYVLIARILPKETDEIERSLVLWVEFSFEKTRWGSSNSQI